MFDELEETVFLLYFICCQIKMLDAYHSLIVQASNKAGDG
jgi:hypothetical protein